MHGGRIGIVGGLRLVYIVVGVDFLLGIFQGAAQKYMRTVGNHLIRIHVGLGARTCLPDHQGKLAVVLACKNFVTNLGNNVCLVLLQYAQLGIGQRCSFLQYGKGMDDLQGHAVFLSANLKIIDRTLRLRSPVGRSWNLHRSHGVFFYTDGHGSRNKRVKIRPQRYIQSPFLPTACGRIPRYSEEN